MEPDELLKSMHVHPFCAQRHLPANEEQEDARRDAWIEGLEARAAALERHNQVDRRRSIWPTLTRSVWPTPVRSVLPTPTRIAWPIPARSASVTPGGNS